MKTETLSQSYLKKAIDLLLAGELVAFPTETVYGLGGLFQNEKAHRAVYDVKGRPQDNPLIVHIGEVTWIQDLVESLPPYWDLLTQAFFPGPLTLIFKRNPSIAPSFCAHLSTIAIRMPSHPMALQLIREVGKPLIAPSANLSGKPSPTQAQDVEEDLGGKIPLIIDGGLCAVGIESTVVSLVGDQPTLLRPGGISKEAIEHVLGIRLLQPLNGKILSPGMKYRHYAPKTPISLFSSKEELLAHVACEKKPLILSYEAAFKGSTSFNAANLYALFREADRNGASSIAILMSESLLQNEALMNRIQKAIS
ncbi:MAG: threonylcarbamoyl-AMP synthase [Simkaniaceae bacterium]|nr:threonylcarbamoyl-AMP synthase [Simkaniaceae bacterium]MCF7852595.1 threonylcarbamoyl-AMP synthase [Simkaniaceae bacterium]